ncbi:uncharacterized protein LOC126680840 isoform X4 [Mercurialis annua]|nr:uncharacterized protein LOC126680840 isoform X4 [Mercurialis annua]
MSSFSSDEDDRPLCKRFKSISTKPMGAGKSTLASSKKSSSKIVSSDRSQEGDPKKSGSTQTRIAITLGGNPQTKASLASGQRSKVPTTKEVPIIGKPTQSSIPVLLVSSTGSLKKSIAAELRALDSDDSDDNEESPFITLASNLPPDENCLEEDLSTYLETIKSMKTKGMAMFEDEAAIANLKECLEVLSSRATHPNIGPKVKMAIDIANDNLPTLHKMYHSAIPTRTFFEKKLRDNEEIKRKLDHLRKEGKELAPMIGTHNKRIDSLEQQILKLQEELRLEKEALTPLGKKFDQLIIHGMSLKKRRATLKKEILAEQAEYDKALKDYAKVKSQISEFFGMF